MKQLTKSQVAPKLKTGDLIEYKTIKGYKQVFIVTQATKKFIYLQKKHSCHKF